MKALRDLVFSLGFMFAFVCVQAQDDPFAVKDQVHPLVIVSGIATGSYHQLATDMQMISSEPVTIQTSRGSIDNYSKMNNDPGVDIVFLQYDVLLKAKLYDVQTRQRNVENIKILLQLGNEEIHLLTRVNANIDNIKDLEGKKVGVGISSLEGTNVTAGLIKSVTGIRWIDVEKNFDEAFAMLLNNELDAMFFVGYAPVQKLQGLLSSFDKVIKLIPITDEKLSQFHEKSVIKAGTYPWLNEDLETFAVKAVLASNIKKESAETKKQIEQLLIDINENKSILDVKGHNEWKSIDLKFKGIDWDIHPISKKVFDL
jgi:TRAP transporter TAXI family solute receptor